MEVYSFPYEVFFIVLVSGEVESTSGWVPLVEGEVVFLPCPFVGVESELKGLLVEITDDGLWNLNPKPFHCDVGAIDHSDFGYFAELEKVYLRPCI